MITAVTKRFEFNLMNMLKRYFRVVWVLSLALTGSSFFLTSCDEEETVKTELLSFGPSGVLHGEDITFIGTGLDQVTSIVFPVGIEVAKSGFKSHTADQIVVTVPLETMEGKVVLKTNVGDIETKTRFGLTYEIVIETLPTEAKPGTNATFKGQFLNYVKEVVFFDGLSVTDFVSQSRTELVLTVPLAAKTGPILFSDGKEFPQVVEEVVNVTLPQITSLSPLSIKHAEKLTIDGTNLDLVTSISLPPGLMISKSAFVSQSSTQIALTVPNTAVKGKVKLVVPSGLEVESAEAVTIILPKATSLAPVPASPGAAITLVGTDLDLVQKIMFPGVSTPVTTFVSQSATEIIVTAPVGVQNGALFFVTFLDFKTEAGVSFTLPGEDLSPLAYVIFDDEFKDNWQNWSWGGPADAANEEQVRFGSKAIKKTFDGSWDGMQLGNGSSAMSGFTKLSVSVYGGPGTNGKKINVILNENWGSTKEITVVEGEWTEFDIPWAEAGNPSSPMTRIALQSHGWAGVIYVDKIGFK
jgi:hypothetical protein